MSDTSLGNTRLGNLGKLANQTIRNIGHFQYSRMSWGSIFAGTIIALSTWLFLNVLGLAIGLGSGHTTADAFEAARAGGGLWTILSSLLAMSLGGYVAGRLCGAFNHLDSELHGLSVWALTTLLSALLLGSFAASVVHSTGFEGALRNLSGGPAPSGRLGDEGLVEQLQLAINSGGDLSHMSRDQINNEIIFLLRRRVANGSLADVERDRLAALLAQRDGVSRDETTLRLGRMEQEAKAHVAQLRAAEDLVARDAEAAARAMATGLLLGLGASLVGAWFGTRHVRSMPTDRVVIGEHGHPIVDHTAHAVGEHTTDYTYGVSPLNLTESSRFTFPATRTDLIRQAHTFNADRRVIDALERLADRSYASLNDLKSAVSAAIRT
jgi:hypothetical protein